MTFSVQVFRDGSVVVEADVPSLVVAPEVLAVVIANGIAAWRTERAKHEVECPN